MAERRRLDPARGLGGRHLTMILVERQVHGYRQGHQLLATSAQIPKADQALIDRLSDVAGPLRPKERFKPYLSAYPLPSGERYVLARTWQDTEVSRAGCVRTLSLVLPAADWAAAADPSAFMALLNAEGELPTDVDATARQVFADGVPALPPCPDFRASELLEALFLEETRPVVLFDAPAPELIALRLLTALWPSGRRRFALSTFALSPRKVSGRDFDLVFAPKDARAKFGDWGGRRVDGLSTLDGRHKWTGQIVSRIFERPVPQLLTGDEIALVSESASDADYAAALRIALLWEELSSKLSTVPTAALGLLDIANSGKVRDEVALSLLEPRLAQAITQAPSTLRAQDAWEFLGAITRKMQGHAMPGGRDALLATVEALAERAPTGGIELLTQFENKGVANELTPKIAQGIAKANLQQAQVALAGAPAPVVGRLIAQSPAFAERVASDDALLRVAAVALPTLAKPLFDSVSRSLLPHLTEDWQLPVAEPLVTRLDAAALAKMAQGLGPANDFAAERLSGLLIDRARQIDGRETLRAALVSAVPSPRRDALLAQTLDPEIADVAWLMAWETTSDSAASQLLLDLLKRADDRQLTTILSSPEVGEPVFAELADGGIDLLARVIATPQLPIGLFVKAVEAALPRLDPETGSSVAELALRRCLPATLDSNAARLISQWLAVLRSFEASWVFRTGLGREVDASVASRNLIAFHAAPQAVRRVLVAAVDDLADVLVERRAFDLDAVAIEACTQLMGDAQRANPRGLLRAAGRMLPTLMHQRRAPVSPLIALLFPAVYRELAKEDDVSDFLRIVPFFDWDRCKAARHELVSAFLSSTWPAADLALAACRSNDTARILRRTAKAYGGEAYIAKIGADLGRLPDDCRRATVEVLGALRSYGPGKYDWRD